MNLEPKVESKALWWDGSYGGVTKDGKFLMMYRKPTLPIPEFDEVLSKPDMGVGAGNFYIRNGVKTQMSTADIAAMDLVIDAAFPTQGGGGGGHDPEAVTRIVADGIKPNLIIQHGDGSTKTVEFGPNIQNTPAFNLAFQLKSHIDGWNHDKGGRGVAYEGPNKLHILPPEMWTMGGQQRGAKYNPDDGTFELLANSLEVNVMIRMIASMEKDCVHFSKGTPNAGDYGMTVVLQRKEGTNWVTEVENTLISMTMPSTAEYPNNQQPCVGLYNRGFKANLAKGGIYRVGIKGILGDKPEFWPFWRMFYSTWDISADPAYWHFQITGAIKVVGDIEDIPPHKP